MTSIVTPFFAPQSHAAVFRAYKLAKYLPRLGWKPYVLTTGTNYLYNEDPSLLEALPPEVEITRARYVEPTLRGLRMALGGRDRTFKTLKQRGALPQAAPDGREERTPGAFHASSRKRSGGRLYQYVLKRWIQVPDAYRTWYGPAVRAGRKLVRKHGIPLVFTSADPYTCHLIGLALKKRGAKWVADLRDPHVYNHHTSSGYAAVFARQRAAERGAVLGADAVTTAASAIAMIVTDMYGVRDTERLHFIPTGLDEALLPPPDLPRPRPHPYVVFSGEFLPEYGGEFLEIFAAAQARPEVRRRGVKLLVVGRAELNGPRIRPHLERLGIEEQVEFVDHLPQQELYALLQGADAAVLLTSRLYRWWCLYAKMVDYIALRKPVLAVVPDPSEARTQLTRARLGVFLDGEREACARKLADFLLGRLDLPPPDEEERDRYTARRQVGAFVEVFESLCLARECARNG